MTKKKKIIIGLCALAVILLTVIGGVVLAKYQTQVTGDGIANVAHWAFEANGFGSTMQTIALNENYNPDTLINGKIAPGTQGSFDIVLDATGSEVGVDYNVAFLNEQNKPSNLKFRYNGETYSTLDGLTNVLAGRIDANDSNKLRILTIEWIWDYETGDSNQISSNDITDTIEGMNAFDYTFDVVVTGTQSAPTK